MMHPPPSLSAVLALEDSSNSATLISSSPTLTNPEVTISQSLVSPLGYHHLAPSIMREEVNAAVEFFLKMVETPRLSTAMPRLGRNLSKVLSNKYKDHWFLDTPHRGQAYRCIEVCDTQGADRVLAEAAAASGLRYSELRLPADLCVWVDPKEVACRFGEELGSFLPIYMNENGKKRSFVDKFDFERLCERTPMAPMVVGRGGRITDRGVLRRVGTRGVERMQVEVERGVSMAPSPSTSVSLLICGDGDSALLTPPSTPPQSPDHSSSSPRSSSSLRSPSSSPVLFTLPSSSPTKHSPPSSNLHHLNNNVNSGYQRSKHYQQHTNINQYNSNNLHSRSPPQHNHHHQQHHNNHHHQQMSVSPTHHYHQHHTNINNNNNNNSHYHSSTTTSNYNIYNNSHGSNLNSNAAFYGTSNGNGFPRSPPRYNGFSGSKQTGKWGSHHNTVFPSSVTSNNNIHHHQQHLHHQQEQQQQQYYMQQKREESPRWLWQGRRAKV